MVIEVRYKTYFGQAPVKAIGKMVCLNARHLILSDKDGKNIEIPVINIIDARPIDK